MDVYINEADARTDIKGIVNEYTTDYAIFTQKRKTVRIALKNVTFVVILVYKDENEELYDKFMKYNVNEDKEMQVVGSDTFFENGKKKEAFHIECVVEGV